MISKREELKRTKDLGKIREHWEKDETVSLKDKNLQELERESIINYLKRIKPSTIIDIGCGDCSDTMYFSEFSKEIYGLDYSENMLKKAAEISSRKIKLLNIDILSNDIDIKSDMIISKRCLINMGNFKNQMKVLNKVHGCLCEKGYFILLEGCLDGLKNLNTMRALLGLPIIKEPFHNIYFEMDKLIEHLSKLFYIIEIKNFSTYYFLTRIYNHLLNAKEYVQFDSIAKQVHKKLDIFGSVFIGPQFLMLLQKK